MNHYLTDTESYFQCTEILSIYMNGLHSYYKLLKITQHDKVGFIKVNDLKLTQGQIFSFLHFIRIVLYG